MTILIEPWIKNQDASDIAQFRRRFKMKKLIDQMSTSKSDRNVVDESGELDVDIDFIAKVDRNQVEIRKHFEQIWTWKSDRFCLPGCPSPPT